MASINRLIEQCRRGDRRAQEQLFSTFAPKIYSLCLRYGKDAEVAQEILQKSFIKMFKNLDGYRGEGSFEGWFRRIVVNEGIEHYRKEKNGRILIEMDAIPEGEKPFVEWDGLEAKDLLQVIRELPEGYRMVFNLFAIEGYSHKEIGEMLSISENTSKSQLSRARQVLKQKLTHM